MQNNFWYAGLRMQCTWLHAIMDLIAGAKGTLSKRQKSSLLYDYESRAVPITPPHLPLALAAFHRIIVVIVCAFWQGDDFDKAHVTNFFPSLGNTCRCSGIVNGSCYTGAPSVHPADNAAGSHGNRAPANRTGWPAYFKYAVASRKVWPLGDFLEKEDRILNQIHVVQQPEAGLSF